ncbi:hypothetical protein ACLOJK_006790, partial [Asimina triloba]
MEKACASLPSGISVYYNLIWPTVSLMKDGLLGDLRFGLVAMVRWRTLAWLDLAAGGVCPLLHDDRSVGSMAALVS